MRSISSRRARDIGMLVVGLLASDRGGELRSESNDTEEARVQHRPWRTRMPSSSISSRSCSWPLDENSSQMLLVSGTESMKRRSSSVTMLWVNDMRMLSLQSISARHFLQHRVFARTEPPALSRTTKPAGQKGRSVLTAATSAHAPCTRACLWRVPTASTWNGWRQFRVGCRGV